MYSNPGSFSPGQGHWLWRWKFKTADRNVRFCPDEYGWAWSPGAGSWVAIKQFTNLQSLAGVRKRIRLEVEMLLDRACMGGGWNSGNRVVYGVPLRPFVEATESQAEDMQTTSRPCRACPGAFAPCSCSRSQCRKSRMGGDLGIPHYAILCLERALESKWTA